MRIGGLIKNSLVDYPGKIAAVVFAQGCNFRCPFCHNADLVVPSLYKEPIPEKEILGFLASRVSRLQGVVVTGGEPTVQPGLPDFLRSVKELGYAVKLDTNGSRPDILAAVVSAGWVDYVAMDIKTSPARYSQACGVAINMDDILRSMAFLQGSAIEYEFRTTVVRPFVTESDVAEIAGLIPNAPRYILQEFVPRDRLLDPSLKDQRPYSAEEFKALQEKWQKPRPPA
jgi:pyruvate formate lyase activating enzyme